MTDEYKLLSPRSKVAMYIKNFVAIVIILSAAVVSLLVREEFDSGVYVAYIIVGISLPAMMCLIVWPSVFFSHYRYIVDSERVDVRKGVFFHTRSLVPIERVHQVDVSSGPISYRLGLADVLVTTAGGTVTIQYLERSVADSIADYLNETVNGIIRDREDQ